MEDPASEADGLRPVEAGLQGSDAPRHTGAVKAQRRRAPARRPPTGCGASRPDSDRHGYADETPQVARLSVSEIERGRAYARGGVTRSL
jgi:hypothetical protein